MTTSLVSLTLHKNSVVSLSSYSTASSRNHQSVSSPEESPSQPTFDAPSEWRTKTQLISISCPSLCLGQLPWCPPLVSGSGQLIYCHGRSTIKIPAHGTVLRVLLVGRLSCHAILRVSFSWATFIDTWTTPRKSPCATRLIWPQIHSIRLTLSGGFSNNETERSHSETLWCVGGSSRVISHS